MGSRTIERAGATAFWFAVFLFGCASRAAFPGAHNASTLDASAPVTVASSSQQSAAASPLGASNYLPVAPGDLIDSLAALSPASTEPAPTWKEVTRIREPLDRGPIDFVLLELAGSGAGVVVAKPEGQSVRVIETYGVSHDGLGVELRITGRFVPAAKSYAVVLVEVLRESRGYNQFQDDDTTAVEASADASWVAIGASTTRAWLAAPALETYSDVRFVESAGKLHMNACVHGKADIDTFALAPGSDPSFGSPRLERGRCAGPSKHFPR